jgi:hypothetical protein
VSLPSAFHDFPADAFPFTLELLDAVTREVCWSVRVDGPGATKVPGRNEINEGRPVIARIIRKDGTVAAEAAQDLP